MSRWLARAATARLIGCSAREIDIAGGGDTYPRAIGHGIDARGVVIGIAHSGNWIAAVAGSGIISVGMDVEQISPRPVGPMAEFMNWTGLFDRIGTDPVIDADRFTQIWTLWEAAVKCNGTALLAGSTPGFEPLVALSAPHREGSWMADGHWATSRRLSPDCWLSVVARCVPGTVPDLELQRLRWRPETGESD